MTSKNERVMDYIAGLEAGEKVSVRTLAQVLKVSEGTAYKSIKQAEAQGLVITRPKVGTVRINLRSATDDNERSLAEAARSIGALCLCGSEDDGAAYAHARTEAVPGNDGYAAGNANTLGTTVPDPNRAQSTVPSAQLR